MLGSTADVVIIDAEAAGPQSLVAPAGSYAAALCGVNGGKQTWAVIGHGRALPEQYFKVVEGRLTMENPLEADDEIVPMSAISRVVGPNGLVDSEHAVREDCVVAAELLRLGI